MEDINFTIPITPVSKKNSQRIYYNARTRKPFIKPSAQFERYQKDCAQFIPKVEKPIDEPINIKCLFVMPTRRKCDLTNLLEAVDDVLVKLGVIADDNYSIVAGHDGSRVIYEKDAGRTEICIKSML